jgi:rSAM/selenodomain-associated transferase 2
LQRVVISPGSRRASAHNDLTVVIPTLDAGETLAGCLDALREAAGAETIVIDGGSGDETLAVARRRNARVATAPRGRGGQLRAGAANTDRPWLLFLHADTELQPGWSGAVARWKSRPRARESFAVFRFKLDDASWRARLLERLVQARVTLLRLPYGDQGLLIHRDLYDRVGGYSADLPLMEDVDLVHRLRAARLSVLDAAAVTSAARWRRSGWLRHSLRNLACLALFRLGVEPRWIARFYER